MTMRRVRSVRAGMGALLLAAAGCRQAAPAMPGPPAARVAPVGIAAPAPPRRAAHADTLHGVVVPDPYRWLEDTLSAEVRAWVGAQGRYTDSVLARLVGRDSLAAHYERAIRRAPTLGRLRSSDRGLVLTRWLGDAPSLHVVDAATARERPVLTAEAIARARPGASIRAIVPSWRGDLVAVGTTERGDARAAVSIVDVATGTLSDHIPDLLTTTSGTRYEVTWLPDDRAFIYPRLRPGAEAGPPTQRLARGRQFLHRIGTPQSQDVALFGHGVSAAVPIDDDDLATRVLTAPNTRWLVGSVFRSRRNGSDYYAAPMPAGGVTVPEWRPLAVIEDRLAAPQLHGDTVYALARRDADRGRIVRRVLRADASGQWEVVVPERRGVITAFSVQADAVYFVERAGGAMQLHRLAHGTAQPAAVALPAVGTVTLLRRASTAPGAVVSVESWATAPRWLRVPPGGAPVERLPIDDGSDGGEDAAGESVVSARLEAPSRDGTLVPVSLVYDPRALRSGRLDGTAPLLIDAYGAFGQSVDPEYNPWLRAWTALGGVYAYAHARGGGELGEAWHQAATRDRKQRSVDDVLGAIDALIARGYTSPGRVVLMGVSFGAIIPGLAVLQRPELFGAVLYEVGQPDEIRGAALDPTAARNIAEIGDLDTPDGVRLLMNSSPYHRVPARIALPPMLVHSASGDYNFGTQMLAGKYVARLQAANTGDRPVLWVRTPGGHAELLYTSPEWAATVTSFVLWQTGDPRYQPTPAGASARR